jgi:glycosyltransferase involved in cell wall biosynthesis
MPAKKYSPDGLQISVVIPTYNRGNLIRRAIQSVLNQTRLPDEVIVVDDGSSDDTREQVASFGGAVRYVHQTNAGASHARNRGVHEVQSEWVAFLDSDDIWLEGHIARMVAAIASTRGAADFYFDDMDQTDNEGGGGLWEYCRFTIQGEFEMTENATDWAMMERQPMMLQTSVFRKSTLMESGGLWERLTTRHDTHLFLKMGIGHPACAVAGCGARQTSDDRPTNRLMSASGPETLGYWLETIPLYEDILARAPQLRARYRRLLRARLANAHWRVSRLAWKNRNIDASMRHAAKSFAIEPLTIFRTLTHPVRVVLKMNTP